MREFSKNYPWMIHSLREFTDLFHSQKSWKKDKLKKMYSLIWLHTSAEKLLCPKALKHFITPHFREFRNALLRALWSLFVIGDATVFDALQSNVSSLS